MIESFISDFTLPSRYQSCHGKCLAIASVFSYLQLYDGSRRLEVVGWGISQVTGASPSTRFHSLPLLHIFYSIGHPFTTAAGRGSMHIEHCIASERADTVIREAHSEVTHRNQERGPLSFLTPSLEHTDTNKSRPKTPPEAYARHEHMIVQLLIHGQSCGFLVETTPLPYTRASQAPLCGGTDQWGS